MRENCMSDSMRGRRKRAVAQRACALLYQSPLAEPSRSCHLARSKGHRSVARWRKPRVQMPPRPASSEGAAEALTRPQAPVAGANWPMWYGYQGLAPLAKYLRPYGVIRNGAFGE